MEPVAIAENIYWVGTNDYETDLFEALWPLPRGISYNSYLIIDDKITLIDTVKKNFAPQLLSSIKKLLPEGRGIDYLIINHMEPDHSGSVQVLRELFPSMTIVGSAKTAEFLKCFYGITENIEIADASTTLTLGKHTLSFHLTPMVHWPETIVTFETTRKILFSGDVFGGFGALSGGIFDDEVDLSYYDDEVLRYFSNIIGKYCSMVQKALKEIESIDISIIAPAHGPVFRSNPSHIISLYDKWSRHETEEGVVCVYASMYGNTQRMMDRVARSIIENGVKTIRLYNISHSHPSYIIRDIWRYKGMILGSCTYNTKLFPLMEHLITLLANKKLENRYLGVFGSYTWSGGALRRLKEFAGDGKLSVVDPAVEVHCAPTEDELEGCRELGGNMAKAVLSPPQY